MTLGVVGVILGNITDIPPHFMMLVVVVSQKCLIFHKLDKLSFMKSAHEFKKLKYFSPVPGGLCRLEWVHRLEVLECSECCRK